MTFSVSKGRIASIRYLMGLQSHPNKARAILEIIRLLDDQFGLPRHQLDFVDALKGEDDNLFLAHIDSIGEEGQNLIWSTLEEGCRSNDWSSLLAIGV